MPSSGCPAAQSLKLSLVRTPALSHLAHIFTTFAFTSWSEINTQNKDQYVGQLTIFHLQLSPLKLSPIEYHPLMSALPVWNIDTPIPFLGPLGPLVEPSIFPSTRPPVCAKNLDHLYTCKYALWIIRRLMKPNRWPHRTQCVKPVTFSQVSVLPKLTLLSCHLGRPESRSKACLSCSSHFDPFYGQKVPKMAINAVFWP